MNDVQSNYNIKALKKSHAINSNNLNGMQPSKKNMCNQNALQNPVRRSGAPTLKDIRILSLQTKNYETLKYFPFYGKENKLMD